MKKLYHEYFHIPENGKISDKVMLGRTVVAALCVILCLCAFSVSTYAYYYMTVVSSGNTVQAATFEVEVTVKDSSSQTVAAPDGVYTLDANSKYTVVVIPRGSAKGFAVVTVASQAGNQALMLASVDEGEGEGSGEEQAAIPEIDISGVGTYYTPQLFEDGQAKAATFTIQTTEAVTMSIEAHWGKKQDSLEATSITVDFSSIDSALLLLEEEEEEELEPATNTDLEENPSFNNPAEPDTPVAPNDSADSSAPVVPNTPATEENGTTDEGGIEGGDEITDGDQSTGEGENTGGEEGAADDAVTDEGNAADENNTVSGDETTGTEVA